MRGPNKLTTVAKMSFVDPSTLQQSKLRHVETKEVRYVPSNVTLQQEIRPDVIPPMEGIVGFDVTSLNPIDTADKCQLPTQDVIEEERVETRAEVKTFDTSTLKRVETGESSRSIAH